MAEHVMVFGSGGDMPARFRAAGPEIVTTLMCRLDHIPRLLDPTGHERVVALPADASDAEWVDMARAVHATQPVTRIAMFGEHDQDRAAVVGAALGLATHPVEVVHRVHHKEAMRRRLRETGVEEVPAVLVTDAGGIRDFGAACGFPCVVKPVGGTASFGVSMVSDPSGADVAFSRAAGEHDGVRLKEVLVERFFVGDQYSVEGFSEGGEHVVAAITRKYSDPRTLVELGHALPAPLDDAQRGEISAYVARVLDALGVEFGPTHTEIVLTADGPRIIETHLRAGGDDIFAMVADAVGVDLLDFQVRQTLGEKVLPEIRAVLEDAERPRRCDAIWFATAPAAGELVEITGAEPTVEYPHVLPKALVRPGAVLTGLGSSYSRLAQARAHATDAESALSAARDAVGRMRFLTRVTGVPPHDIC
ncbi:ATP-grasp domain-containing protein [Actinoplanes sp. NPDC051346]|uniref:ATP-grasp domain-containing protein n=1 Tax=Actinoplanes sp. NPDC051346 TaxID=3155048 RepID=UPI003419AA87